MIPHVPVPQACVGGSRHHPHTPFHRRPLQPASYRNHARRLCGINGGLTQREGPAPEPGAPINGCNIVVGIETGVDEVFARALALGASEASPLEDMEGVGRGGYLFDPDGNLFGLMSAVMSDGTNAMAG